MKNKELFEKTVSILVKAYLNDTLEHADCSACAVGNIIAGNNGYKVVKGAWGLNWKRNNFLVNTEWDNVFCTSPMQEQDFNPDEYKNEAKRQIDSTGYTLQELAKIEFAFESVGMLNDRNMYMYNGLMAVVDVLAEIHEVSQEEVIATKKMFAKV